MSYRPASLEASVYAPGPDGRWYVAYPQGNAPSPTIQAQSVASIATVLGALATGAGFFGVVNCVFSVTGNLSTAPAPVPLRGHAYAIASVSGSLFTSSGMYIVTASPLPAAKAGSAYSLAISVSGGVAPYTFASSALPSGMTLNAGVLSGTPTVPGTYSFSITANDSGGSPVYPSVVSYTDNEGPNGEQTPNGIQSTASQDFAAGTYYWAFTTCATYAGQHNGQTLVDTDADTFSVVQNIMGPADGQQANAINASQQTVMWECLSLKGDTRPTTFSQAFGTGGYGTPANGDADYQAFLGVGFTGVTGVVGSNSQANTGTNNLGIAQGTNNLASGTINVTAADLPCLLLGMCTNTSQLGSGFTPTPGTGMILYKNLWDFGSSTPTTCLAFMQINAPGAYQAVFNQPSSSAQCSQTFARIVKGSLAGNGHSATTQFSLTVGASTQLAFSTSALPSGTQGTAYSYQMVGMGGAPPYAWDITNGALPTGMSMTTGGLYQGTPTVSTTGHSCVMTLTDSVGTVVTQTFNLVIAANTKILAAGAIAVSGNTLVDSTGSKLVLQGCNMPALEACFAQQNPAWYRNPPNWSTYAGWKPNVVRIPLNAASFLGLSCYTINSAGNGWQSTTPLSADPFSNCVATVDAAIAAAQAIGCMVFLDLHWSAPEFSFGGVTGYAMPLWQPPFMNTNTDLAFWKAVATRYGTQATPQPGINNHGIVFELFNEPYIDQMSGYGNNSTVWNLMKSGGSVSEFYTNYATSTVNQAWTALGYQTVLNAIRTLGAQNVLACGGCGYCNAPSGFATFLPTDTLSPAQIMVTQHVYPNGSYPYGTNVFPNVSPDSGSGTSAWNASALAVLAAGHPLGFTEDGGSYGASATSGEPHTTYMFGEFQSMGVSAYIPWEWSEQVASSSSGQNVLMTTGGTPTEGLGATTKALMVGSSTLVLPSAPPGLILTLQGQTTRDASSFNGNVPIPQNANSQTLAWQAATPGSNPIASYQMERTAANGATFASLATGLSTSNLLYADNTATLCVSGTRGTVGPGNANFAANTYLYQVRAIDSAGNAGPWSATQRMWIYRNGIGAVDPNDPDVHGEGLWKDLTQGACTVDYSNKTLPANGPNTTAIKITVAVEYGYWLPTYGNAATNWDLYSGFANYLYIDIYTAQANQTATILGYVVGDQPIYNASGAQYSVQLTNYGTFKQGGWATFKIPLADFTTDYGSTGKGPAVRQKALYKPLIQPENSNIGDVLGFDNMYLSAT